MLNLIQSIFKSPSGKTLKYDDALIERATERVVDGTDTRLRAVTGYRKKLRSAVECAVEYIIDLADGLPPAIEFSKQHYGADPRLRAFFASANRLQEAVNSSQAIRGYLSQKGSAAPGTVYAGFGVEREERKTLGMDLVGDILRRDVEQIVVNFCNPRFVATSDDEIRTRWELKKRGFDNLIYSALQRLISERKKQDELAQERHLLRRKLHALTDGPWALDSLLDSQESKPVAASTIEKRIAEIETELGRIKTDSLNLDHHLAVVAETLSSPQEHLRLATISLTLNRMGVKMEDGSKPSVDTLRLNEFSTSDGRRAVVLLAAIPSDEIQQPPSDLFKEASRYL